MANYRILVTYDPERTVFTARAPELEHCTADGATRAEAVAKIEEEIAAQLANMKERGGHAPAALDDGLAACSGEITSKISKGLHRDLLWQARLEGIGIDALIAEILAAGLESRRARTVRRAQPSPQPGSSPPPRDDDDDRGQRADSRGNGGRRGGRDQRDGRYQQIMDDPASFREFLRQQEQNGGQPPRGRRK